jgi:hypothetical protein
MHIPSSILPINSYLLIIPNVMRMLCKYVSSSGTASAEDYQILCVPHGGIYGRIHGYKWSLLKVKEGKYKREHGGTKWKLEIARLSLFQVPLKLRLVYGKGRTLWFSNNN